MSYADLFNAHVGYRSVKWEHYLEIYDQHLKNKASSLSPVTLLELGIQNGGSLEIWAKYLPVNSRIIGVDIEKKCSQLLFPPNITVLIGDASDPLFIKNKLLNYTYDIIIDDASHMPRETIAAFTMLFGQLAPGGLYFVEDTHTSYWAPFKGGFKKKTAIEYFKTFIDALHYDYIKFPFYFSRSDRKKFGLINQQIRSITFYDSILVIEKNLTSKCEPYSKVFAGDDDSLFPQPPLTK